MAKRKLSNNKILIDGEYADLVINGNIVSVDRLYYKVPFKMPKPIYEPARMTDGSPAPVSQRKQQFYSIPQSTFVNEYYPSGHAINNPDLEYWQDVCMVQEVPNDDGTTSEEYKHHKLQRRSFGLQQIGVRQLLASITGYPVNMQNSGLNTSEYEKIILAKMKQIWLDSNMENAFYEFCESIMITGDGAIYQRPSDDNESVEYSVFSYLKGDTLLPHYDRLGKMDYFVRSYNDTFIDVRDSTESVTEYVEIYDKNSIRTFLNDGGSLNLIDSVPHNYPYVPVDYCRFDSSVWSLVQDNIDSFEFLMSMLSENNMRLAFQILMIQTEGEFQLQKGYNGASSILKLTNKDDKAEFLGKADSSNSFELELKTLYSNIMAGMGIVQPENRTSGDTPVGTSKLRYAPAIEVGERNAKKIDASLDGIIKTFKTICGTLNGNKATDFNKLKVNAKIDIYTVQDESEWNNGVIQAYINGIMSKETAVEKHTMTANDELFRLAKDELIQKEKDVVNNGGI